MWCSMKQNICLTVATNTVVGLIHHNKHQFSFPCCRIYLVDGLAKVQELLTCLAILKLAGCNDPFLDILFDVIKQFPQGVLGLYSCRLFQRTSTTCLISLIDQ